MGQKGPAGSLGSSAALFGAGSVPLKGRTADGEIDAVVEREDDGGMATVSDNEDEAEGEGLSDGERLVVSLSDGVPVCDGEAEGVPEIVGVADSDAVAEGEVVRDSDAEGDADAETLSVPVPTIESDGEKGPDDEMDAALLREAELPIDTVADGAGDAVASDADTVDVTAAENDDDSGRE